ncbi:DNA polymerase III subunit epsilon [Sphingomonas sp. CFBP 8760]|nr:DNA polymerase III subunit epsilon [Sphingomonas sp. CFBP 8760]
MEQVEGTSRVDAVGKNGNVRVQYRLDVQDGSTGVGNGSDTRIGVVVAARATGESPTRTTIIDLAMRRFRFDRTGVVTHVDRVYRWYEDPGVAIPPDVAAVTGLTDADVAGRGIKDEVAVRLLRSACIVISHRAAADRPRIERRLEGVGDLAWACSMTQIDWRSNGFDGVELGHLLRQAGWFHEGRGAGADVDAVIQLLRHRFDDRTALTILIKAATQPSWMVRAVGAAFDVKDMLKERGYRWDLDRRVWWREVSDDARIAEELWLAANVYAVPAGARAMGPDIEPITAATRFL